MDNETKTMIYVIACAATTIALTQASASLVGAEKMKSRDLMLMEAVGNLTSALAEMERVRQEARN